MRTGYHAVLHRMGRWWTVDVPEAAVHTQCRTLDEAEVMARDAIARVRGVPPDTVTVELTAPEFAPLRQRVLEARRQRAAAEAAERQALADAAHVLVEEFRLSPSDTGRLLGLPPQEALRLASAPGATAAHPGATGSVPGATGSLFGAAGSAPPAAARPGRPALGGGVPTVPGPRPRQ